MDPLIWFTMIIFVGIRIAALVSEREIDVEILSKTEIDVLGAFLSFFLVFFVNQTNGRFLEMYGFSRVRDFLYFFLLCLSIVIHMYSMSI